MAVTRFLRTIAGSSLLLPWDSFLTESWEGHYHHQTVDGNKCGVDYHDREWSTVSELLHVYYSRIIHGSWAVYELASHCPVLLVSNLCSVLLKAKYTLLWPIIGIVANPIKAPCNCIKKLINSTIYDLVIREKGLRKELLYRWASLSRLCRFRISCNRYEPVGFTQ